jgi:hypothetical protein
VVQPIHSGVDAATFRGMPNEDVVVDPAFTGPPSAAQGGYVCGLLARYVPGDAEVTLTRPVPLGVALRVETREDGVLVYDGSTVVAEAASSRLDLDVPQPPTLAEASLASEAFPGFAAHPFPGCVVCGTDRSDAAAFRIFPGPLAGRDLLASVWYPGEHAVSDGVVRTEFAWAALDCPAGWAAAWFGTSDRPAVLGRMTARLYEPVLPDEAYILVGWLAGRSGRKLDARSALYSPSGTLRGFSRQTWITLADAAATP